MPDKNALLDWFAVEPQMRAWDIIVALRRDDLNRLLEQAFLERFNATSFGKPFTARVGDGASERYLQDFILGPPRLSFDNTGLIDSRANLSMAVVGGSDVVLQHGVHWEVSRLEWIQPMHGPVLRMVLELENTPGSIEADGSLKLDLNNVTEFILDFRGDANVQRLGGEAFEALFEKIPAADKVFELGQFVTGDKYFPKLRLFKLRTQANKDSGRADDGAVLVFMSKDENFGGTPPGENSDFRFLIPNDLPTCSATVLFRPDFFVYPVFVQTILGLLDFYYPPIIDGFTCSIPAAGMMMVYDVSEVTEYMSSDELLTLYGWPPIRLYISVTSIGRGLEIKYLPNELEIEMTWEGISNLVNSFVRPVAFKMTNRYRLSSAGATLGFELISFDLRIYDGRGRADLIGGLVELIRALLMRMFRTALVDSVRTSIDERLNEIQQEGGGGLLRNVLKLHFGETLIAGEGHTRHEIITFNMLGKVDGIPDIQPRWPNVPVGGHVQFEVANTSRPVNWHVEALNPKQMPVGSIDATGRYTVPANARLSGFVRERIRAEDTQSKACGYSMVTIAHDTLSIAPLVQVLSPSGSMLLDAGSSDASPTFQWKVDGRPAAGNPTGAQILFTAGEPQSYPTFTRVQVSVGAVAREACVITLAKTQVNTLKVRIVEMDSDKGEVMLHMTMPVQPGKQLAWSVEFGGGAVNAHAEDQAKVLFSVNQAGTERVAVIKASVATPGSDPSGVGFIVLPLPLLEYPTIYSKLMLPDSEEVTP
ncbi:hypothetical protein [Pseudomonas sp. xss_2]|uniref:hypothetical protein n=1 Tax=Pseudomonas sp. xss_2 TaxID=3367215 RepID=UPI00370B5AB6